MPNPTDIQELLEQTESALGGTDRTYTELIKTLAREKKLVYPSTPLHGQMLFFRYQPISEKFLQEPNTYYDIFPLIFVTKATIHGFEGINFHYLQSKNRMFLFNAIMKSVPTIKGQVEWRNRIALTYDILNASRKMKFFKHCYKKYLWEGVRKKPVMIPYDYWETLCGLEIGTFVGKRRASVYRETMKKINRGNK